MEGNLRSKIDWASLIEGNLPFLLSFTSHLRAISKYKPPGGLIFGGAYTRRSLFSEFYGNFKCIPFRLHFLTSDEDKENTQYQVRIHIHLMHEYVIAILR